MAVRRFRAPHNYVRIAPMFLDILREYGVPVARIVKAVTDNGSNFDKAFRFFGPDENEDEEEESEDEQQDATQDITLIDTTELLNEAASSESWKLPPHHACACHSLSLIFTTDIKNMRRVSPFQEPSFSKCQAIWNKCSRSTTAAEKVTLITGIVLPTPTVVRWNSFFNSLKTLMKYADKLSQICKATGVPNFKDSEIEFMKEYLECVEPIATALNLLQGEKGTSFYGDLLYCLLKVEEKLKSMQNKHFNHCESFLSKLHECFRARFCSFLDLSINDAIIATISHPFYKLRWCPDDQVDSLKELFISTVIINDWRSKQSQLQNTPTEGTQQNNPVPGSSRKSYADESAKQGDTDDWFDFKRKFTDTAPGQMDEQKVRNQCIHFLNSEDTALDMLGNYPYIKNVFVKFNTPLPSSAPVERLFHNASLVLSQTRKRLSDKHVEECTLLMVNKY